MVNWKKTLGVSTLAAGLMFGSFTPFASAAPGQSPINDSHPAVGGPFDLGVANDERLIESLVDRGLISNSLSAAGKQKALQDYLSKRAENALKAEKGNLKGNKEEKVDKTYKELSNNAILNGIGQKKGFAKKSHVDNTVLEEWDGGTRTDKVLVLMIEYPDFPASEIIKESTDMYYDDYTKEHYSDMIFGENGYKGPNGEDLISMKQYYEEQSGGSYTIDGEVAGWYTAEHEAAYYGGNNEGGNDNNARALVREAVQDAAKDPNVDLSEYDQEDRYDLDGDGNYREPDGLVDHLMIIHSSVGEEAGGGQLGGDAIWSHRWNLGGVFPVEGTEADVPYWGGAMAAYDYTIEPADGAAGVFAHEYGHDLELPDEYDTIYSGAGEPIGYWSIMSSGSWAGDIPGTEPTGFSAWAKEFLQGYVGGNWLSGSSIDLEDVNSKGTTFLLDQANDKGTNNDAVRINLPQKETIVNTPFSGETEYFSGSGNNLDNSMVTSLDLTNAANAQLSFKTWYEIELDWDYASVQVKEEGSDQWVSIPGNITTTTNPNEQNPGYGITGHSDGWTDGIFDLSAYAGKKIDVKFNYWTDVAAAEAGFYVDDVKVSVDGNEVVFDDAEGEAQFTLDGFTKDHGTFFSDHYYLLEWRTHNGVDEGLKHLRRGASLMEYDEGLLVWYVDNSYSNNWTGPGYHPGEGFLGVVDAHQEILKWSDHTLASTRYQINDAAFGLDKTNAEFLDYRPLELPNYDFYLKDNSSNGVPLFDDSNNYLNEGLLDAGRNVPTYGLKFRVLDQSDDKSAAKIVVFK